MLAKRPISTSELYQLMQTNLTLTKTHMFVQCYVQGCDTLLIVDSTNRTVCRLNLGSATWTYSNKYVFRRNKTETDIFTIDGEFVTKLSNKTPIVSDGNTHYSLSDSSSEVFSVDEEWNISSPIYTRKNDSIKYFCKYDDFIILRDCNYFNPEIRYILLRDNTWTEIEQYRNRDASLFLLLAPTKLLGVSNRSYSIIDLTNNTETVLNHNGGHWPNHNVGPWTDAVFCKTALVYHYNMHIYVGSKQHDRKECAWMGSRM